MVEILKSVGDRLVPRRVHSAIGTAASVNFGSDDELGRELMLQWDRREDPAAAAAAEFWAVLPTLAWILTHDLAMVSRAMRRFARTSEDNCHHDLACLQWAVHDGYCLCAARGGDWADCRCLDAALSKLRARLQDATLSGEGGFRGDDHARPVSASDILGLRALPGMKPNQRALRFSNGLVWAHFSSSAVRAAFSARGPVVSEAEVLAWIAECGTRNSKKAWTAFHSLPKFEGKVKYSVFTDLWKDVHPDQKRGRPRKESASKASTVAPDASRHGTIS